MSVPLSVDTAMAGAMSGAVRPYLRVFRPFASSLTALGFVLGWAVTRDTALLHIAGGLAVAAVLGLGYRVAARRFGARAVVAASVFIDQLVIAWLIWQMPNASEVSIAYLWSLIVAALLVSPLCALAATAQIIALLVGVPLALGEPLDAAVIVTQSIIFVVLASSLMFVRSQMVGNALRLERSQRRLIEAQRVANIGSWEWLPATDELRWSDQMYRLWGMEPGTPVTFADFTDLLDDRDRDRVQAAVQRALEQDAPYDIDIHFTRDGETGVMRAQGAMTVDALGRRWMVGTAQDVTELRRVEMLQAEFVASASHELRTPTTIISGFAQTLEGRWDDLGDTHRRAFVRQIADGARRLTTLIEDVLQVSRIEARTLEINATTFDLAAVASECVRDMPGVRATLHGADAPLQVDADPSRVRQVLDNLLENAMRYGADPIDVHLGADGSCATIRVDDAGAGIDERDRERVFDRFVRLDASRQMEGTGLGLYISRQLALAMGGSLEASTSPRGGASFLCRLPLAAAPSSAHGS